MRIAVVGAGITGLAVASYLTDCGDHEITVLERETVLGGRANTYGGGEHCARLFLDDYDHLLALLDRVPADDGRTVARSLRPLRRLCRPAGSEWVEISHLNPLLSSNLTWRQKASVLRERRRRPILADEAAVRRRRALRLAWSLSITGWLRVARSFLRRPRTFGFDAPTEDALIRPWARYLTAAGVALRTGATVQRIEPADHRVRLVVGEPDSDRPDLDVDAVVVTAFLPDAAGLLTRSAIDNGLPDRESVHCKCLTVELDPREPVLRSTTPVLLSGYGLYAIVQPAAARGIALFAHLGHPTTDAMLHGLRTLLDLEHPLRSVSVRDNLRPSEGLHCADYVDPTCVLTDASAAPNVYLAGSYIATSYSVDSGEGAARSAFDVVHRMAEDHGSCLGRLPVPPTRTQTRALLHDLMANELTYGPQR